jgi:hypothetical protein
MVTFARRYFHACAGLPRNSSSVILLRADAPLDNIQYLGYRLNHSTVVVKIGTDYLQILESLVKHGGLLRICQLKK